jgi:hypothetical protein
VNNHSASAYTSSTVAATASFLGNDSHANHCSDDSPAYDPDAELCHYSDDSPAYEPDAELCHYSDDSPAYEPNSELCHYSDDSPAHDSFACTASSSSSSLVRFNVVFYSFPLVFPRVDACLIRIYLPSLATLVNRYN